jgi:hypothetical protein
MTAQDRLSAIEPLLDHRDFGQHSLPKMDNEQLYREYCRTCRDTFDRMFGHNAERYLQHVKAELFRRGLTHVPNIFGAIEVNP